MKPRCSFSCSRGSSALTVASISLITTFVTLHISSVFHYTSANAQKDLDIGDLFVADVGSMMQRGASVSQEQAASILEASGKSAPRDHSPAARQLGSFHTHGQRAANSSMSPFVTVFSTECSTYHDWQTVTLYDSWYRARIPGTIVRLLACSAEALKGYSRINGLGDQLLTHVHDNKENVSGQRRYPPLNKPWGLHSWLTKGDGRWLSKEAVVMIVDPDFSFQPGGQVAAQLAPIAKAVSEGLADAVGLDYKYVVHGMKVMGWELPWQINSSIDVKQLQSIGPPILITKDKLSMLVDGWYNITLNIVRQPELQKLVHDGNEPAPWIAEMCGYTLAAAGWLHHQTQVEWPELRAPQPPYVKRGTDASPMMLHYSHPLSLCDRAFGKTLLDGLDLLSCEEHLPSSSDFVPPSLSQLHDQACKCCIGDGYVHGRKAHCFEGNASQVIKQISWDAWDRVSSAILRWRAKNCVYSHEFVA